MADPVARIGDRIKFRIAAREGVQTATRKVVGQHGDGYEVRYRGYPTFIVHRHEVAVIYRDAETLTKWDDNGKWISESKTPIAPTIFDDRPDEARR